MALSDKFLKDELEKAKLALASLEEGQWLHGSIRAALEKEIKERQKK